MHKRTALKRILKFKTAPTCFGSVTSSSGSELLELAKVTVVILIECFNK
jgi:hypothetical protein